MTRLPFPDPPLEDGLILLCPWSMADAGPAWTATQDPLIWRHTHVPERQSEDDVRRFVADREPRRLAGHELGFVIADATDEAFLGCISLLRID